MVFGSEWKGDVGKRCRASRGLQAGALSFHPPLTPLVRRGGVPGAAALHLEQLLGGVRPVVLLRPLPAQPLLLGRGPPLQRLRALAAEWLLGRRAGVQPRRARRGTRCRAAPAAVAGLQPRRQGARGEGGGLRGTLQQPIQALRHAASTPQRTAKRTTPHRAPAEGPAVAGPRSAPAAGPSHR